jgi:regulator of cell morphogenesis and NO signaling
MTATTTQTVRDIATENPVTVRVFEKYGIEYCCGGQVPLADACAAKGLNVDEVIASLEAATEPLASGEKDWSKESLASLAAHIVATHHAYISREVPRLNELAAKVVSRHGDTREELPVIQSKLAELGEELIAHQGKEEVVLFPYIGKLERFAAGNGTMPRNCFGSVTHPIEMMTRDHDFAGNLMAEIRKLSRDYTPPEGACPTFRAFYDGLREFEQDLHQHIHLENNILFPRAIELEALVSHR